MNSTTRTYPRSSREAFRDASHAAWLEHHKSPSSGIGRAVGWLLVVLAVLAASLLR